MCLPEFSTVFFIAQEIDGRTLLFDNAIWFKRSAWPRDGRKKTGEEQKEQSLRNCGGSQSNGKPRTDVEIVSTVTPPSLILSSLTLAKKKKKNVQLHAQTYPYLSAGLCSQPPLPLISVARINLSRHVPAVWSHDTLCAHGPPADSCLAGINMYMSKYLQQQTARLYIWLETDAEKAEKRNIICVCSRWLCRKTLTAAPFIVSLECILNRRQVRVLLDNFIAVLLLLPHLALPLDEGEF